VTGSVGNGILFLFAPGLTLALVPLFPDVGVGIADIACRALIPVETPFALTFPAFAVVLFPKLNIFLICGAVVTINDGGADGIAIGPLAMLANAAALLLELELLAPLPIPCEDAEAEVDGADILFVDAAAAASCCCC
jgi:hypothetical protein